MVMEKTEPDLNIENYVDGTEQLHDDIDNRVSSDIHEENFKGS